MKEYGNASLIHFPPRIGNDGQPYLPLVYTFPFGKEVNVNQNSAIVRPFKRVLDKGGPVGTISYIFYEENNNFFIVGAFAYTGKRIYFFPGILDRRMTISPEGKEILSMGVIHTIDHLSLESNYRTYHVTLLEKETINAKYRKLNTKKIRDNMFLWFVLSVQDEYKLEPVPFTQEIRLKWHNWADLNRRYSIIMKSREDFVFNVTNVDDQPQGQFFLNFEFFVSMNLSHEYESPPKVYHTGLVSTTHSQDQRKTIVTKLYRVLLKEFSGCLWVRVSKIIGNHGDYAMVIMS